MKIEIVKNSVNEHFSLIFFIILKKLLSVRFLSSVKKYKFKFNSEASDIIKLVFPVPGFPYNTKFSCQATTRDKRVFCVCSKMITESKELVISAQLLNLDGSSGLEGLYEGNKEALIAGTVISDFSKGMVSAAQNRISTPFGSVQDNSVRNQILQGAISSADTTSDVLLKEMKSSVPKITVDAGTDVIIYFMEALK